MEEGIFTIWVGYGFFALAVHAAAINTIASKPNAALVVSYIFIFSSLIGFSFTLWGF